MNTSKEQPKSKLVFDNLKSDFFLRTVFDILNKKSSLEIVKINKSLQKRLNLNINDYKDYSQLYSAIEVELKLADNEYGKFINIPDEDEDYYHIYFSNSKEEIKQTNIKKEDNVKKIKIIIDHQVNSFKNLFQECNCISSIIFTKFTRINITDMSYMFYLCSSLKELNLSPF